MDLKRNDVSWWFVLLVVIIFVLYLGGKVGYNNSTKRTMHWRFKGVVQKVWYSEKNYPYVIVAGKEYYLNYTTWHFDVKILVGDTIIKERDDLRIKIIKPGSTDTIYFNERSY
jgi:hypothetical protein